MLIAGVVLSLFSGLANASAAALEKREALVVAATVKGFRLLAALIRRPWWLVAMAVSVAAWVAQATSLALLPVAVAASLLGAGRALLVVLGVRWLGERFRARELVGVGLASAGAIAVAATSQGNVSRVELSNWAQLALGGGAVVVAFVVTRWRTGIGYGAGAGVLFATTGAYTKEIADRFATHGLGGLVLVLAGPSLWVMLAFTVLALRYLQTAFREANAASVSATNAAVSMNGLILIGFVLYHEPFPSGPLGLVMLLGILATAVGTALLAARAASAQPQSELVEAP